MLTLLPYFFPGKTKSGVKYKGSVEVPNLSDENDMDDLDVSFTPFSEQT